MFPIRPEIPTFILTELGEIHRINAFIVQAGHKEPFLWIFTEEGGFYKKTLDTKVFTSPVSTGFYHNLKQTVTTRWHSYTPEYFDQRCRALGIRMVTP